MHLFGLTGGIAAGKTTVANRLRERGVPVVDADVLAREAVAPGTDGLAAVVAAFGPEVLAPDSSLDRKAVAERVFSDAAARKVLNGIVHPRVAALGAARAQALAAAGEPLACYEAPLLVENGLADAFRPLVVVTAPEHVQVARTMARDGASEEHARARVRSQLPQAQKVAVADFVLENLGDTASLHRKTDQVLAAVCRRLGVDPARYGVEQAPT